jgi:hypothetical protein
MTGIRIGPIWAATWRASAERGGCRWWSRAMVLWPPRCVPAFTSAPAAGLVAHEPTGSSPVRRTAFPICAGQFSPAPM